MIRFHPSLEPMMEPVDAVRQWPDNPNNGDLEAITESIEVNGVYAPVVAQRSTGFILAGNHRYHAMVGLGATTVPVLWLDVDDAQARRIALVDNRAGQLAWMDNSLLVEHLDELVGTDLGLVGTGYDESWLTDMHSSLSTALGEDFIEDDGFGEQARQRKDGFTCPKCGFMVGR